MTPETPVFTGAPAGMTDQQLVDALIARKAAGLEPVIEHLFIAPPSRQQRRAGARKQIATILQQGHNARMKRKTRRRIATASARRNRR